MYIYVYTYRYTISWHFGLSFVSSVPLASLGSTLDYFLLPLVCPWTFFAASWAAMKTFHALDQVKNANSEQIGSTRTRLPTESCRPEFSPGSSQSGFSIFTLHGC